MKFKLEEVAPHIGPGLVIASKTEPGDFGIGPDSRLDGVPVTTCFPSPRAARRGDPGREDLFVFVLRSRADMANFTLRIGEFVELR